MPSINPNYSNQPLFKALKTQSDALLSDSVPSEAFTSYVDSALQHETFTRDAPDPKLAQFTQGIVTLTHMVSNQASREYLLRCALKVMEKGIPGHVGVAIAKCVDVAMYNTNSKDAGWLARQAVERIAATKEEGIMPEMTLLQGAINNESIPSSIKSTIAEKGISSLAGSEKWNIV
jgi:hypothetical protein